MNRSTDQKSMIQPGMNCDTMCGLGDGCYLPWSRSCRRNNGGREDGEFADENERAERGQRRK